MTNILQAESDAAIVQRALGWVEEDGRFDSLEDDSDKAREGRLRYDIRRRAVLEAMDWNFARRRVMSPAVEVTAYPDNQPFSYPIPTSALRIRNMRKGSTNISWSREDVIFAAEADAQTIYTIDARNPAMFPPVFTSALEFLLAADFAMIFSRSVNRSQVMLDNFRTTMQQADQMDGQERSNDAAYDTGGWVDAIQSPFALGYD